MPRVGFEHTTPVFERAKKVHALERAATVIDDGVGYQAVIRTHASAVVKLQYCIVERRTSCSVVP
jgi:hypothetical protein